MVLKCPFKFNGILNWFLLCNRISSWSIVANGIFKVFSLCTHLDSFLLMWSFITIHFYLYCILWQYDRKWLKGCGMDTGDPNLGSKQIWWDTFCKFLCKMYGGQMHFLDQSKMYAFMIYLIEMKERRPILKQYYEPHLQKSKLWCFTLNHCR